MAVRDYSSWNYHNSDDSRSDNWQHINTYVERAVIPLKGRLTLGDSYTPSDVFDSLPFRGAQIASDDNMLPDSLKGFAPTIRGIAKSNAQVTIKEGANKRGNSSRLTQSFHFFMFEPIFSPVNALNQPI